MEKGRKMLPDSWAAERLGLGPVPGPPVLSCLPNSVITVPLPVPTPPQPPHQSWVMPQLH